MIKVNCMSSPLQTRTSEREIVLRGILASRLFGPGEKNVVDFGLPGPNPVLSLTGPSYDLGEAFMRKALLRHMCVIQVHLLREVFPLWPSTARGMCREVGNTFSAAS